MFISKLFCINVCLTNSANKETFDCRTIARHVSSFHANGIPNRSACCKEIRNKVSQFYRIVDLVRIVTAKIVLPLVMAWISGYMPASNKMYTISLSPASSAKCVLEQNNGFKCGDFVVKAVHSVTDSCILGKRETPRNIFSYHSESTMRTFLKLSHLSDDAPIELRPVSKLV